jgi:AraC family transcriptional regulator
MFPQRRETFDEFALEALVVPPGSALPAHRHERAHLLMVFAGEVVDETEREAHQVRPGELLVRPAGITHANCVGDGGAHLINIDMTPALAEAFAPLYGRLWGSAHLTFPMVRQLPEQIREEMAASDPVSKCILPALIEQLLGVGARAATGSNGRPEWLRRALEILDRSFVEGISIAEVARWSGVSASRLSHGFREHFGRSIGDYVRDLRVEAAARALRESDDSIAAIADACGFADQAHLSRLFRELRGTTPNEYRRKSRMIDR